MALNSDFIMLKGSIGQEFGEGSLGKVSQLPTHCLGLQLERLLRRDSSVVGAEITLRLTHSQDWHLGWKDLKTWKVAITARGLSCSWASSKHGCLRVARMPHQPRASRVPHKFPAYKAEAALAFINLPRKSPSSIPTVVYWFQGSHKSPLLREEWNI